MPTVWKQEFCHEIILLSSSHKRENSSGPSQTDGQNMANRCRYRCVCSWTDLDNLHGRLAHRRLFMGCDMVAGRGAVQKVPAPPLTFLPVVSTPVTDRRRLLSEPNLPPRSREGPGTLRELVEARQTLGSAEGQNPPKRKERRVEQVRLNQTLVGKRVNSISPGVSSELRWITIWRLSEREARDSFTKNRSLFFKWDLRSMLLKKGWTPANSNQLFYLFSWGNGS